MNARNCPTEDVLLDYVAGRLDPAQAALFELHADQCGNCAVLRNAQMAVWGSLGEWKAAPVSEGFNRELWRRIDADAGTASWTSRLAMAMDWNLWKRVAPLVVAILLVVTGFVFDHENRQTVQPAGATAPVIVTASDADQLDRALDDIQLLREVDVPSSPAVPESKVM